MSDFKIGDKVVFIPNGKRYWSKHNSHIPISNDVIYTIRGFSTYDPSTGILLEGITNDIFMGYELSYAIQNFRKVIENDNFAEEVLGKVLKEIREEIVEIQI